MDSVSPVLTEAEVPSEQVIALDNPEYYPIVVARVSWRDKDEKLMALASYTRFRFTAAERELIAAGADLLLSQPHHGSMMPVGLQLAMPGEYPVQEKT
jgi:hypothetical protein